MAISADYGSIMTPRAILRLPFPKNGLRMSSSVFKIGIPALLLLSIFCIDVLLNILDCIKGKDQMVWPVFYNVDSSKKHYCRGIFKDSLAEYKKGFTDKKDRVLERRSENEVKFIRSIVEEVIILDPPKEIEVHWDGITFKKMKNLRILIARNTRFSRGLKHLPNSLRLLEWWGYPSPSLPFDFHAQKFVILKLQDSFFVRDIPHKACLYFPDPHLLTGNS
ncbi:hypothetical protein L6164_012169 [Bauhinia variegata]|uniref:Uncharacterized protein n=1 Tax=Bauhinia variegata TaxID=167791 RepID=A0ACB9P859_BAUVA|nr:hypothetical protein L6164_012169 [Bauhinia variegata]